MMKIVLDTNVYISAFMFQGICKEVINYNFEHHQIFISPFIIEEISRILTDKFNIVSDILEKVDSVINYSTTLINPTNDLPVICRDKDDNHILQLAEFIHADYLITGDKDLLILKTFHHTIINSPKDFLATYNKDFDVSK